MDKVKINKGRMYQSTDLVLDKFADSFASIEELAQAHQELKGYIGIIDEEQQVQVVDHTGLTRTKIALRADVTRQIQKFSMALKAYATVQKDTDLLTKSSYRQSDLARLSDPILFDVGTMLYNLATPLRGQLAKYFLTAEEFTQMEFVLAEFRASIHQKRMATTVSKSSTKKINEVYHAIDKLLREVIDVYVAPFQFQNPDFYSEYGNARIVVGYTGHIRRRTAHPDTVLQPEAVV